MLFSVQRDKGDGRYQQYKIQIGWLHYRKGKRMQVTTIRTQNLLEGLENTEHQSRTANESSNKPALGNQQYIENTTSWGSSTVAQDVLDNARNKIQSEWQKSRGNSCTVH